MNYYSSYAPERRGDLRAIAIYAAMFYSELAAYSEPFFFAGDKKIKECRIRLCENNEIFIDDAIEFFIGKHPDLATSEREFAESIIRELFGDGKVQRLTKGALDILDLYLDEKIDDYAFIGRLLDLVKSEIKDKASKVYEKNIEKKYGVKYRKYMKLILKRLYNDLKYNVNTGKAEEYFIYG